MPAWPEFDKEVQRLFSFNEILFPNILCSLQFCFKKFIVLLMKTYLAEDLIKLVVKH